jgi:hypothetical protein
MTSTDYVTIRIQRGVVDDLRRLVRQLAAEADRDVTQSDALRAALGEALGHVPEVAARLTGAGTAPVQPSKPGAPPDERDGGNRS